jgi:hypothetical protein
MSELLSGCSFAAAMLGCLFLAMAVQTCADTDARHPGLFKNKSAGQLLEVE